jgi:hypothetical protein
VPCILFIRREREKLAGINCNFEDAVLYLKLYLEKEVYRFRYNGLP